MTRDSGLWRSRWAAVGAAVAVSFGAGGLSAAQAVGSAEGRPVFVSITPCRLLDTRPDTNVGPRNAPIGPNSEYTATVHGTNGNCTIPAGATGIMLNLTVVNGTASSFLTVYPADATRPNASTMNWVAAQPPTPNEISVKLSPDGKITFYNLAGTVDVLGDIVGYHQNLSRTTTKRITMPAQALNESSGQSVITRGHVSLAMGLVWQNSYAEAATLAIRRPDDIAPSGTVSLVLLVTRTTTAAGNLGFFARARDYDAGDPFADSPSVNSAVLANADTTFQEITIELPVTDLAKDWWAITIQRDDSLSGAYPDDVVVHSVSVVYPAIET